MPVEIKELVIRAVVRGEDEDDTTSAAAGGLLEEDKTALVESCVQEVLKTLRRSQER